MHSSGASPTQEQRRQYHEQGYFILESALSNTDLAALREECDRFVEMMNERMDREGVDTLDISHRRKRYFISNRNGESPILRRFLFSETMAEICRATLGEQAYLFNEQFVVKFAEVGMKFGWHQDSGYVGYEHCRYLSCWIALDDVCQENGTVYVLPYDRAGQKDMVAHQREEKTNDLVGYRGDDPGIPVEVPAGSMAVFSSTTFHRSGANHSPGMRRVYLCQYSPEPILTADGKALRALAEPFLHAGARINDGSGPPRSIPVAT